MWLQRRHQQIERLRIRTVTLQDLKRLLLLLYYLAQRILEHSFDGSGDQRLIAVVSDRAIQVSDSAADKVLRLAYLEIREANLRCVCRRRGCIRARLA